MSRLLYLLLSFEGRIGRTSFLLGSLAQIVLIAAGAVTLVFSFVLNRHGAKIDEMAVTIWTAPLLIFSIWTTLALAAKRFHDRDLSGAWVLIALIPGVGTVWWLVQMLALPGSPGENRYGLPPAFGQVGEEDEESDLGRRIAGVSVRAARYAGIPDIVRDAAPAGRAPAYRAPVQAGGRPQGFGRRGR